jgi:hypothetical protein
MTSTEIYASRPKQDDRLEQTAQKRQSIATAPAVAADVGDDRRIGTTLTPSGDTIPAIRLSRAEQATGSAGRSSAKQAPSKTSEGVASGSIEASDMSSHGHTAAPLLVESNGSASNVLNIPRNRARPFDGYRLADFNPIAAVGIALCGLSGLGVIWLALTLIDAWSKV